MNAEMPLAAVLAKAFPWCSEWENELRRLFDAYVQAKHAQNVLDCRDLLLSGSRCWASRDSPPNLGPIRPCSRGQIPDANPIQAKILRTQTKRPRAHCRR